METHCVDHFFSIQSTFFFQYNLLLMSKEKLAKSLCPYFCPVLKYVSERHTLLILLLNSYFKISVDSHTVVRNNSENNPLFRYCQRSNLKTHGNLQPRHWHQYSEHTEHGLCHRDTSCWPVGTHSPSSCTYHLLPPCQSPICLLFL